ELGEALDDRQAEAGSLLGALDGDRSLPEGGERDRDFLRRDAGAVVLDRDVLPAAGRPADADPDLAAARRELHRVRQQIEGDLADGAFVGEQARKTRLVFGGDT